MDDPVLADAHVSPESLITVLGVTYVHAKTSDGGDIYVTRFGLPYFQLLQVENWHERRWFEKNRIRLEGTSAVYRVPTKRIGGMQLDLVVKNCRVGEDVPLDTHTLLEFINAEFNSPWEEFSLVTEMREGAFGPAEVRINTQQPLAIYVPPERLQLWQTGRSRSRINKVRARHPGIDLDILRQYKLVYGWIHGKNAIQALESLNISGQELEGDLMPLTNRVIGDLDKKGYVVADMKPAHIIIGEKHLAPMEQTGKDLPATHASIRRIHELIAQGEYSIIDYELLLRTPVHEQDTKSTRRHSYLDDQRDRFIPTPLPPHLKTTEIFGVPYLQGHAESTGGILWVVGKNARLFDYFLPERWRKTPSWKLSERSEVYYTVTKDNIHVVWRESRVGEKPRQHSGDDRSHRIAEHGFNSPFEEFAAAHFLSTNGVPTVYARAIYMTGSTKLERSTDVRRYRSHRRLRAPDGSLILRADHNYISIRGYYNGPDSWVARQDGSLCKPMDLSKAVASGFLGLDEYRTVWEALHARLRNVGYDGSLLEPNDVLIAIDTNGQIIRDQDGWPEGRICNFELIRKI